MLPKGNFLFLLMENHLSKLGKPRTAKGLAVLCARIAEDKIATDIVLMDLTNIESAPTDFFVICTCETDIQAKSLVDKLMRKCKELGVQRPNVEGTETYNWALVDFFDVVLHVMQPEARGYYRLEKLWGDAKFMELNEEGKPVSLKK
jgi:ribosome-associated protein